MFRGRLFIISFLLLIVASPSYAVDKLRLSTTTSTDNSGLLDVLLPVFEAEYDAHVDVIAVGTGKALRIGSHGDSDVVFVHAPAAELAYVEKGDFIDRQSVMHNDFVLIGPRSDPANIKSASSAKQAFTLIAQHQSEFISRGDESGTHKKEMALWQQAGIEPVAPWYIKIGQGMGATLIMANQKLAYTLTDRGTQIAYEDKLDLTILFEGDEALFNPYHVMAVNPAKHPHVHYSLAKDFIQFVTGEKGQAIIRDFGKGGKALFYPDVIQ